MPTFPHLATQQRADRQMEVIHPGTGLVVFNKDLKTAQNDPDDPHSIALGAHVDDAKVRIVDNAARLPVLELYGCVSGATDGATDPVVNAFGFCPDTETAPTSGRRAMPYDDDTTNFKSLTMGTDNLKATGLWLPLQNDEAGYAPFTVPLVTAELLMDKDSTAGGATRTKIYRPIRLFTQGLRWLMVPVVTATTGPTAAMLIGRCRATVGGMSQSLA